MIDHVSLNVSDVVAGRAFQVAALAPLGIGVQMEVEGFGVGFGVPGKPFFWIAGRLSVSGSTHVAFHCEERVPVDAFHAGALAAGGRDNGAPGLRPHYHPTYYAAFVLDPDGNNIETVCHTAA